MNIVKMERVSEFDEVWERLKAYSYVVAEIASAGRTRGVRAYLRRSLFGNGRFITGRLVIYDGDGELEWTDARDADLEALAICRQTLAGLVALRGGLLVGGLDG